jgi:hypothetical protein
MVITVPHLAGAAGGWFIGAGYALRRRAGTTRLGFRLPVGRFAFVAVQLNGPNSPLWWPVLISGLSGPSVTAPSAHLGYGFTHYCQHHDRISLRIHHKAAPRYGLPTYSP